MSNLLEETKEILKLNKKKLSDILWVGSRTLEISLDDFVCLADTDYDDGFGSPEVAQDLLVCGDGFWLERHEYDGSEWWEFKEFPKRPNKRIDAKALTIEQAQIAGFKVLCGWENLDTINGLEE